MVGHEGGRGSAAFRQMTLHCFAHFESVGDVCNTVPKLVFHLPPCFALSILSLPRLMDWDLE